MTALPDPFAQQPGADWANGLMGSFTPASQTNARNQQPTSSSDNPFTDVLNHVTAFNAGSPIQAASGSIGGGIASPRATTPTGQANSGGFTATLYPQTTNAPSDGSGGNVSSPQTKTTIGNQPKIGMPIIQPGGPNPDDSLMNANTGTDLVDANGVPWSASNPPPKPANTEDPEVWASWARKFQYLDPTLQYVTGKDASAYRVSGYQAPREVLAKTPEGNNFIAWWQNGKPSPSQTPPPADTTNTNTGPTPGAWVDQPTPQMWGGTRFTLDQIKQFSPEQRAQLLTPEQLAAFNTATGVQPPISPTTPAAPPQQPTPPTNTAPPAATPTPAAPATATPAIGTDPNAEIQKLIDLYSQTYSNTLRPDVEGLLNPMFARQRQMLARDLNAQGAALGPGVVDSGGFGANRNEALANLSGQQSATLAGELSKENLARIEQNTKFAELATEAGMNKFVTEFNGQLARDNVRTNADLQKWLASEDNILKRYGIDSNDVLQRYLGKLGIDKANIDANATIQSAQLHAAAAEAAANASTAASMANAKMQYDLGIAGLSVDREKNIGNFILALLQGGNASIDNINNILTGIPPGSIVVKP